MNFYEKVEKACRAKGITVTQMCREVGFSRSLLSDMKSGRIKSLSIKRTNILCEYFNVPIEYFAGNPDDETKIKKGVRIPVYGNVAAGIAIEAITDIEDYKEISPEMASKGEYIALRIKGDSMQPRMQSGDVVIARLQDDVDSGDVAIIFVNGSDATCKKIQKVDGGVILHALNPAYAPVFYNNKQIETLPIRVLGKVVELRAKF